MNTEINQDLGSLSVSAAKKTASAEDCQELCSLIKAIQIKAQMLSMKKKPQPMWKQWRH